MLFLISIRRSILNFWKLPICTTHTWIPIHRNTGLILYTCHVQIPKTALSIQSGLNSVQVLYTNQIHGTPTAMNLFLFCFSVLSFTPYYRTKVIL